MTPDDSPPPAFPGQEPGESIERVAHEHGVRLFLDALPALAATAVTLLAWMLPGLDPPLDPGTLHVIALTLCPLLLALHARFLARLYKQYLRALVLTDRKVHYIQKTLFTRDDQRSIEFPILLNVRKHQRGVPQNALGYGSLILETPETALTINFLPDPDGLLADILRKREETRPDPKAVLEEVKEVADSVKQ